MNKEVIKKRIGKKFQDNYFFDWDYAQPRILKIKTLNNF
jgi:hypothetical protein